MNGRLTFLLRFLLAITVILILWVPVWLPIPSISQSSISFITHAAVYIAMPIAGLPMTLIALEIEQATNYLLRPIEKSR